MMGMLSDIGNYRKSNQDSVGYFEDGNSRFYIIADGMGGHNGGEVASKLAVNTTIKYIKKFIDSEDIEEVLIEAVKKANSEIYKLSNMDEELKGMGTTITACYIKNHNAVMANVGDSSGIIVENGKIKKITKDHSLVQELIDLGNITEEEASNHPNKNIITRAIGTKKTVEIDIYNLNLENISKVILCTDGLTNVVSFDEIYDIVLKYDAEMCCSELIDLSKAKDSKDNISVIVFEGEDRNDRNHTRE